jgi:hypothetical protein
MDTKMETEKKITKPTYNRFLMTNFHVVKRCLNRRQSTLSFYLGF